MSGKPYRRYPPDPPARNEIRNVLIAVAIVLGAFFCLLWAAEILGGFTS